MKKKLYFLGFVLSFFSFLITGVYAAEDKVSVALTSDYVFRGVTQSNNKSAIQPAYQLSQEEDLGFYAGIFASNVAQGSEVDVYGGLALGVGNDDAFIFDIGAIEYLYTDPGFAPASHETYIGVQYDKTYLKYYFAEENVRYLDIGTGFEVWGGIDLLLHFGEVFGGLQNGNDYSVTLQKDFTVIRVGLTATQEDKTVDKASNVFAYVSTGF